MPYIPLADRHTYDIEIERAFRSQFTQGRDRIIRLLQREELTSQDGHVNYVFTAILLKWQESMYNLSHNDFRKELKHEQTFIKNQLKGILYEIYTPPKYFVYNRAMGVLACMSREFSRRTSSLIYGTGPIINDIMVEFYKEKVAPYENEKIKEHGDIEFNPSFR